MRRSKQIHLSLISTSPWDYWTGTFQSTRASKRNVIHFSTFNEDSKLLDARGLQRSDRWGCIHSGSIGGNIILSDTKTTSMRASPRRPGGHG